MSAQPEALPTQRHGAGALQQGRRVLCLSPPAPAGSSPLGSPALAKTRAGTRAQRCPARCQLGLCRLRLLPQQPRGQGQQTYLGDYASPKSL